MRRAMLLGAILAVLACRERGPRPFAGDGLAGPAVVPPLPKPELVLTATDGTRFDLQRETEGVVTLLFFGYTSCPDRCPLQLANIAAALKRMDPTRAERIRTVFVTVDPRRDTPDRIRAYLDHFDRRFVGLTGDSASIAYAFTQLRLGHPMPPDAVTGEPGTYTINHNVAVFAFTTDNLAHVAYLSGFTPDQWLHDLTLLADGT